VGSFPWRKRGVREVKDRLQSPHSAEDAEREPWGIADQALMITRIIKSGLSSRSGSATSSEGTNFFSILHMTKYFTNYIMINDEY
jgi:hypothetical protein